MNISGASEGVPSFSWDGTLVQAEEAPGREQSEENCDEKPSKSLPKPQGQV